MRPCFSLGHQDVTCERDERGICVHCASVVCAGCDRSFPADGGDVHEVTYVPGEDSPGYVCTTCLADDSDGVPVPVAEDETSAQTVRERVTIRDVGGFLSMIIETASAS